MRIALVTDGIWPYVLGGMQKHSYYLCKYLSQQGVKIDLYHFNQSTLDIHSLSVFSDAERANIRSILVPFPDSLKFPGHYLFRSLKHADAVYAEMLPHLANYDFIYTKGFTGAKLIRMKSSGKIKCAPIGVNFHGYEMFQVPPSRYIWLQQLLLLKNPVKWLSKQADVVFSYGGKITGIIESIGVSKSNIEILPSGVEKDFITTDVKPVHQPIRFLYLGRYERRKGIEEINQVISSLIQSNAHGAQFAFIGPLPESTQIHHPSVIYYGEVRDRNQLLSLIRENDVLLCPSWSEGMPNVILEAMSQGLAVLATDVGAVSGLVNTKTGWLLPSPSFIALKRTILSIINKPNEVQAKKQAALNHLRDHFTWEKLSADLIQILQKRTAD
jgi:glycosyltransferase involved in cell wall biosynthesis